MISAVRGPENLPPIPLKNVKQTNKVFITVHTIEWPNINIGTRDLEDKGDREGILHTHPIP